MKIGFVYGAILAASIVSVPFPSDASGGHHGHHKHHRHFGYEHGHGHRHWHYDAYRAGHRYRPIRYGYPNHRPPGYHRDSPIGIIVGGVIGGVLGNELSHGDPFTTGAGAIAGGVIGHELSD